jgi:hypothetical protein
MSETPTVRTFSKRPETPPPGWLPEMHPPGWRPALRPGHYRLGRALTILLACVIGVNALGVLLDAYGIGLFASLQADPSMVADSDLVSFDNMALVLAALNFLVLAPTCIVAMTWLYQAYGCREADPSLLPHARWWTIGGWLIPIMSVVRPFQILRDLYLATTSPPSSEKGASPVVVPSSFGWWWACWLLGNALAGAATRLADSESLGLLQTSVILDLAGQVVLIGAAVLFISIVRSITHNLWCGGERLRQG